MKFRSLVFLALFLLIPFTSYAGLIPTPDGAFIHYELKGQGPAILLVHGWTMSGKFWQKQVDALAKDFTVVVMDLRGHGNSSKILHGLTIPQYAKDVQTVIETLKLEKVTLAGWSLAGPVVLEYWKQFGNKNVKALALVDMTPFPFSPADWNSQGLKNYNFDRMNALFNNLSENRRTTATGFINNMFKKAEAPKEELEWMLTEHLKTPTPIAVAIYSDYLMRDYTDVLKTITVPTTVFSGDSNIFKKGIEMGKYISSQIPNSKFVAFENSGHMPFYEEPGKFNEALAGLAKEIK